MKKYLFGLLLVSGVILGACGNSEAPTGATGSESASSNELVVSTFGLSEDIVKKDIMAPFEEANDAKITLEVGNSADRFTKFKNNPKAGVDVIELAQNNSTEGTQDGLFLDITEADVPNLANLTDNAKEVFESGSGVPIAVNSIGIVYDKEKVGHEITSWDDLWSEDLKGQISIPDITVTAGPLMLYVASDYAGQDIATDNGEKAFDALTELKPNVVKTYSKSSDLANMFQSGEISVAVVADFAVDIIKGATDTVTYVVPESGTYANFNTVNIPKDTKNKELALKFVDHRISEESQKAKALSLNEGPVNKNVELTAEEASNKTYGEIADRAKAVDFKMINENMGSWVDQWNRTMNN
ncbi:ABC transporter substrate-binding protein [Candidatus Enterococcus willemsii]|uniref:Spermidine/putrescine ABC transporter substrate-binding protein n=1 Tax=Candidatus Enterococcus willemsii TaxID=1857215 RepID=A0ABQ6Z0X4_9ENTE|nr:ABC transporter substrate-binding protein [Enterococcus sp. CU12B]KAF1304270.1 spermidine/putrescine ABC transporter substrate-binding protein [Enterococcus sp. CU12B]